MNFQSIARFRNYLFLPIVFACLLTGSGCDKDKTPSGKDYGDDLIVTFPGKPSIINPLLTTSTVSAVIMDIIFDGLITFDESFRPQAHLAKSWKQSSDGLEWTFYLRKGVRFHDGVELTAEDVKFTLEEARKPNRRGLFFNGLEEIIEVNIIDRYTFQLKLKKQFAPLLDNLFIGILPKHLFEGSHLETSAINYQPVGTGPFQLVTFSDDEIVLVAHDHYFLGRPYLNKIVIKIMPNDTASLISLLRKEQVDLVPSFFPEDLNRAKVMPSMRVHAIFSPYYHILAFNNIDPLFSDPRVRRALNYAINKNELIEKVLEGKARISSGTIIPDSWAYDPSLLSYPFDPEMSLHLLKKAGWSDLNGDYILERQGRKFQFTVHTNIGDDLKEEILPLIQQQLRDIGVIMKVKVFDPSDLGFLHRHEFQSTLVEIFSGGDPDFNYLFLHSSQIDHGLNVFTYKNDRIDHLLEAGRRTMDQENRKAIYFEFQKELHQDPPGIFLFWGSRSFAIHKRFKGVKLEASGIFNNIHEWYVPKNEQKYP